MGSDPEKLFPYEALLKQLRKFGVYSVFVGALLFPMLCAEVDSLPDFDEAAEDFTKDDGNDNVLFLISKDAKTAYNKKVTDMFIDLARHGYI